MLDDLEIKNFKNLRDFKINSLKRVNLLTGKNNTGKSSILEAICIYASRGDVGVLAVLLAERGEVFTKGEMGQGKNMKALSSLFTDREIGFLPQHEICITASDYSNGNHDFVKIGFARYFLESQRGTQGIVSRKKIRVENEEEYPDENLETGLMISTNQESDIISLDLERERRRELFAVLKKSNAEVFQLVQTRNIDRDLNGKLWDDIALTEKEQIVIDALKIIEPTTERITFTGDQKERTAVIKLAGSATVWPLRNMGDGINRLLTVILALVNADNGYLLIDEFENGLHHSVQKKLWEIIFQLSERLNVQVFATTHSEDCIAGFESVMNEFGYDQAGQMLRLEYKNGAIRYVDFDADELYIATEQNIEIR